MAKKPPVHYPCIGYCVIDKRGYCVACGRPPTLGLPEVCATVPLKTIPGAEVSSDPNAASRKAGKPSG